MKRDELSELHYIAPIANLLSIMERGLLSHTAAAGLEHQSVSMAPVQEKRARKCVPGGRRLHEYVNLYFCARNPMLFKRKHQHQELCVLRVDPQVLDLAGAVVTDQNAASDYVFFNRGSAGLGIVDRERTFAEYWTAQDPIEAFRRKAAKCAEVLVPDRVAPGLVLGVYVSCEEAKVRVDALHTGVPVSVNRYLFFMGGGLT